MTNREESTQFSLTELLKLEDERVADARRTDEHRKAATEHAKRAAEERVVAEATARAAAARKTELDELARREAMQKAIVEQARLDVEARTRTDERELERRHELALASLRTEDHKGQLGTIVGGTALGAAAMLAAALGIHFAVLRPASEARVRELASSVTAAESRVTELEQRGEEDRKLIASLRVRPDAEAPAAVAAPRPVPPTTRTGPVRAPTRPASPTVPDPCAGSKDPLCGLQR